MLQSGYNRALTFSNEIIKKTSNIPSQASIEHIPLRLNTLLLGYNTSIPQSTLLIPYHDEDFQFINSMKSLSLKSNLPTSSSENYFLFYNTTNNTMQLSPFFKEGYGMIGKYALAMLGKKLEDFERVYYYKMLLKYFENCIRSKVSIEFMDTYIDQICKDVYNYNREVGFQVISNFLFILDKLKNEPGQYATMLTGLLSKQFLSLFIMYKTWNNEKIRNKVIEMILTIQGDLRKMQLNKDEIGKLTIDLKTEVELLESLCDHICIREEIKEKLRKVFNVASK